MKYTNEQIKYAYENGFIIIFDTDTEPGIMKYHSLYDETTGKVSVSFIDRHGNPTSVEYGLDYIIANFTSWGSTLAINDKTGKEWNPNVVRHKHADLIIAWANGANIQAKDSDGNWFDIQSPMWYNGTEYRIKPDLVNKWKWVFERNDGYFVTDYHYSDQADYDRTYGCGVRFIQKIDETEVEMESDQH